MLDINVDSHVYNFFDKMYSNLILKAIKIIKVIKIMINQQLAEQLNYASQLSKI